MSDLLISPNLVWGLLPRFVGLLYVLAFASIAPQTDLLIGSHGLFPIADRLRRARRDFPGLRRFFVQPPSLFWINSSDAAVRALPWLGVLCGLCAIVGGPISPWALGLAWLLWLSLEPGMVIFPWDTMLQEVGFLVLFLPTVEALPSLLTTDLPLPGVAFMFRWLVLRLMLGFGKLKFITTKSEDALYLRGFFVWMPLPSPLAWFGHHGPRWLLKISLYFMFVAEVIAPILGFFSGPLRALSLVLLVGLMLGIQATGNWGFFNVGYILLCVCLLDTQSSIFDLNRAPWADSSWQWPQLAINGVLFVMFLTGVIYLVVADSWVSRAFVRWPFHRYVWNRPSLRALVRYLQVLSPFRIVNGYGVFPPQAEAALRVIPVFEGSNDGVTWQAYRYKYMPTRASDRAPFVSPHHPRLDMLVFYAGAGISDACFFGSMLGDGTPYAAWTQSSWLDRVAQRLLDGEPRMLRAFAHNPFPEAPPRQVRVSAQAMTASSREQRKATGDWWHIQRLGSVVPARGRERWPYLLALPEPELFHPDWFEYKRQSVSIKSIEQAFVAGVEPNQAILVGSDLTRADVELFWQDFQPALKEGRGDFTRLHERAEALKARFGVEQIQRMERVLQRFVWFLRLRTERQQFADATPTIPLRSVLRYQLLLEEIVTDGADAYTAVLAQPSLAAERCARSTDATQLWSLAMLRYDAFMAHAASFRWLNFAHQCHKLQLEGIFEYFPLMVACVPVDEEFCPHVTKHANGEHTVEGFFPPPGSPHNTADETAVSVS